MSRLSERLREPGADFDEVVTVQPKLQPTARVHRTIVSVSAGLWLRTVLASQGLLVWVAVDVIARDPVGVSAES